MQLFVVNLPILKEFSVQPQCLQVWNILNPPKNYKLLADKRTCFNLGSFSPAMTGSSFSFSAIAESCVPFSSSSCFSSSSSFSSFVFAFSSLSSSVNVFSWTAMSPAVMLRKLTVQLIYFPNVRLYIACTQNSLYFDHMILNYVELP